MEKFIKWLFKPAIYIACIIILEVILEKIHVDLGVSFKGAAKVIWSLLAVELFFPYLLEIAKASADRGKINETNDSNTESKQAAKPRKVSGLNVHLQRAAEFIPYLISKLRASSFVSFLFVCTLLIAIPVTAAQFCVIGRTVDFFADMRYSESNKEPDVVPTTPAQQSITETYPPIIDTTDIEQESTVAYTEPQGFLTDPNRLYELSSAEYNSLYFESGPYAVTDWCDPNCAAQVISQYITDLRHQSKLDVFDRDAPTSLQNTVSYASELETHLANSNDLDNVIDIRIDAYHQYPKYRLTKLLTANYQRYALEYDKINGSYSTIEYYYAQSVFWLFESLTFSNVDDYSAKIALSSIKMRYHDIAAIAPEGSRNKQRAMILFQAFKILENSVFE